MCFMLAAGKKATVDGSVLIGRSCDTISTMAAQVIHRPAMDYSVPSVLHIPSTLPDNPGMDIPQVAHTYAYTATAAMRKDWNGYPQVLGGVNEYQVCAGASTGGTVKKEVEELTPWPKTVLGDFIMTLVLERCKTAREGILLAGELTEKYGARGDNYIIGDKDEAWLFEQYQGYHWAAARVPDDKYVIMANCFRIAEFDPEDTENFLGAPDLVSFALEHGLWDPKEGPFNASRAYGTREMAAPHNYPQGYTGSSLRSFGNQLRVWGGIKILTPSADISSTDPSKEYELFWKPDQKLDIEDFLKVMKSYYQDTEYDEYKESGKDQPYLIDQETGHYRYAPAFGKCRLIGCPNQATSWVCKIRGDLPEIMRATFWAGIGPGTSSPHVPYYAFSDKIPEEYQKGEFLESNEYEKDSAFWLYTNIGNLKNLYYQALAEMVQETWEDFESRARKHHALLEKMLVQNIENGSTKEEIRQLLADFSYEHSLEAYRAGDKLLGKMFTRLALVNNPHTVLNFQDPKKWKLEYMIH